MVHKRIGLEPRWYIAAYRFILDAMIHVAITRYKGRKQGLEAIMRAIFSAVFIDMDLSIAAYQDAVESEKIQQISTVTDQAVAEISRGIEAVNEQVLDQSASVKESFQTTDFILKNLEGLNQLIVEQASSVTESSASIEEMIANIQAVTKTVDFMSESFGRLQASSEDGRTKIGNVVDIITNVAAQSEKLQEANSVIKTIAARTNLLAMNAAIEAAHAGDAGRGFAIVSDEIRKLAEMSTLQSKEISANIKTIRTFIETGAATSAVANDSFKTILDQIRPLAEYLSQIKGAMDEQSEGSHQILEATSQINKITVKVRDGSIEMLEGSRTIEKEMAKILAASETVRVKTSELIAKTRSITESVVQARLTAV